MSVIVCGGAVYWRRVVWPCWGRCDGARRRVVIAYNRSPYYDPTYTCCHCGDSWSFEGVMPRPFRRGWREKAAAQAKQCWAAATRQPPQRDDNGYLVMEVAA